MSQLRALPPVARVFTIVVILAGMATAGGWLSSVGDWSRGDLIALVALAAGTALAERFPLEIEYRSERAVYSVADALWTGSLLVARPGVLALSVGTGVLAGQALLRRPPLKVAFNVGQFLLGMSAAVGVFALLGAPAADDPWAWPAAAIAMGVFQAINTVFVGIIIALAERVPFRSVALPTTSLLHWVGNVAVGIVGALVWVAQPLALPLLLVPLGLTYFAYREWVRAAQERDWMARMGHAADAIADSGDLSQRITDPGGADPVGRLATTLNRMLSRIDESFRRERKFIRETSHELRTPITISKGYLEVLPEDASPEELAETHAIVVDELRRMARIVEDMNRLAYLEDPAALQPDVVPIDHLVTYVAAKAGQMLDARLVVEPPPAGEMLRCDEQRVTQALINLLKNAADHTPAGSKVRMRVRPDRADWRFEVADTGGGLDDGLAERIFDPYVRGEESGGSGLGLAIVASIARSHGGAAGVDNRPGEGATFWLRIPG
jgi:signal transduction histidine kinase